MVALAALVVVGCRARTVTHSVVSNPAGQIPPPAPVPLVAPAPSPTPTSGTAIVEGVIFSLTVSVPDGPAGTVEGFTRRNDPRFAPGGARGRWNVDAFGRLYPGYLLITYPAYERLGPEVIPASRLIDIQFGDGGISRVADTPAPG